MHCSPLRLIFEPRAHVLAPLDDKIVVEARHVEARRDVRHHATQSSGEGTRGKPYADEVRRSKSYLRTHIDYRVAPPRPSGDGTLSAQEEAKREARRLERWHEVMLRAESEQQR